MSDNTNDEALEFRQALRDLRPLLREPINSRALSQIRASAAEYVAAQEGNPQEAKGVTLVRSLLAMFSDYQLKLAIAYVERGDLRGRGGLAIQVEAFKELGLTHEQMVKLMELLP